MSDVAQAAKPAPRQENEINAEYTKLCVMVGQKVHRSNLINNELGKLQGEISAHLNRIIELEQENLDLKKQKEEIAANNAAIDEKKAPVLSEVSA